MIERFDPWSAEFVGYPYHAYAKLRDQEPVSWFEPTGQWLISRYTDVNALLRDRRLGRSYLHLNSHEEFGRQAEPDDQAPFWRLVRAGLLDMEPPDHTRLRRLVSQAFTPARVAAMRPAVRRIADTLVDALLAAGGGDLIADYAEPLPVTVIAELLGVPEADRALLRPWSADICGMYELNPSQQTAQRAVRACQEFSGYLRELAALRRADPCDDLISALVQVRDEGDRLSDDELVGTCALLLNAGHEATVNVTGNGWWALFRHPEQLAALRDAVRAAGQSATDSGAADRVERSAVLTTAIEELMRFDTPLQMFERWVLSDIEVAGVTIPRGSEVALLFGSANHDPTVFADPDRLDLSRVDNPHITFGAGIHFCLGGPMARVELAASFGALLRRAPMPRLIREPQWKTGYIIRGLTELPVEF